MVIIFLVLVCAGGAFAAYYFGLFASFMPSPTPAILPVTVPVASSTSVTAESTSTMPTSATTDSYNNGYDNTSCFNHTSDIDHNRNS